MKLVADIRRRLLRDTRLEFASPKDVLSLKVVGAIGEMCGSGDVGGLKTILQ